MTPVPPTQPPAAPEGEVNALREALAAATPGPWHVCEADEFEGDWADQRVSGPGHEPIAGLRDESYEMDEGEPTAATDAALIVAAVNALPALLADLEAARERVRVVEGERDAARAELGEALTAAGHDLEQAWTRAESAEAALAGLRAGLEALADDFASNVDRSNGRSNYGDNEAWESAARQVRALLGGAS